VSSRDFRIGVLGSGNGSNCEAILEACATGRIPGRVALVLSDVADAGILERARKHRVEAQFIGPSQFKTKLEQELEDRAARLLRDAGADLVALAGYLRVLKPPILRTFTGRIINVHPSLLPAFPGLRAWEQALNHGVKVTGCTVHFVDEGVDSGPIILQQPVPVLPNDTPTSLHQRIQLAEHNVYPEAIRLFAEGKLKPDGRVVRVLDLD
jgi:phosphoribosylglycinamide formyltransferase 1